MAKSSWITKIHHAAFYYIPAILRTFITWLSGVSETSSQWNLKTAFTVSIARAIFNDPARISMLEEQEASFTKPPITSSMWVCKDEFPATGKNNLSQLVREAVSDLSGDNTDIPFTDVATVEGEWVGHRYNSTGVYGNIASSRSNEERQYHQMANDTKNDIVLIYLHGGQFYLRNPESRRSLVHALAQRTGGRCFSMAYRLSPQHMFPSALLDLLLVYLSLLYPPPSDSHLAASPPTSICICGDSSGGNIAAAFLQLILHLNRKEPPGVASVLWNDAHVPLPCPGAVCIHSGYMDLTRSLPSEMENLKFDIIPSPGRPPTPVTRYFEDAIWPPEQPRHHVYAPTHLLTHPLVSPITARDWKECPTQVWLSVGQECLADGNIVLAKEMAGQGVDVELEIYEGMPHDFLVLLSSSSCGQDCFDRWAKFVKRAIGREGPGERTENERNVAIIHSIDGKKKQTPLTEIQPQKTVEELIEGMEAKIQSWGQPPTRLH
ncbi:uncharacterized protein Z518_09026 [Rhinocladiella mackenziei CBS 650.93]|uniref:Alpha/beta hydrolase fold-3 domain-containing protein n=1 Tax=Rhinocladiella mackenziei CBS 650.93 TaxID=1442369 RepID=A0A0D2IDJ0_9EURO|nr:uncharacterized protein Z518_09026 [Rhinocladiella mackenziei CBS 650.93]KIX01301.1 hypothetical protein Z518_09026 [Rhinocladiella mackenziei CBS 650.93]